MPKLSYAKSGLRSVEGNKYITPKSGNAFINTKSLLIKEESIQTKIPYIPTGFNQNNLLSDPLYNDNNTIHFDKENNESRITFVATGLSSEFILSKDEDNEILYNPLDTYEGKNKNRIIIQNGEAWGNKRINLQEKISNPSTLSNASFIFPTINEKDKIEQYLTKGLPFENKFTVFKDREYSKNFDFINATNKYSFFDTKLFEEIAIEIELDTPVDTILQNTAYVQNEDTTNINLFDWDQNDINKKDYDFSNIATSIYDFRKDSPKNVPRANTPFIIYNFDKNCWEYRGMPMPYYQINKKTSEKFPTEVDNITTTDLLSQPDTSNIDNFHEYFNKYFLHQNPLTNISIINPKMTSNKDVTSGITLPTSQFGFPIANKFHAFKDNLFNLSKYINKPFILDRVSCNFNIEILSQIAKQFDTKTNIHNEGLSAAINFFLIKNDDYKNQNIVKDNQKYQLLKYSQNTTLKNLINNTNFPNNKLVYRIFADENFEYNENKLLGAEIVDNQLDPTYSFDSFLYHIDEDESKNRIKRSIITFGNATFNNSSTSKIRLALNNNSDLFLFLHNDDTNIFSTGDYYNNIFINSYVKKSNFDTSIFNSHILNDEVELPSGLNFYDINSSTRDFLNNTNGRDIKNAFGYNIFSKYKDDINIKSSILSYASNNNPNYLLNLSNFVSDYRLNHASNFSPYILQPTDEISFCMSISPLIIPELIRQRYTIKKGKVKFILYGYIPRDNKKLTDSDELLNLNHKNIYNGIIDQTFVTNDYTDLTYLQEYINTFYDRIFIGSHEDFRNPTYSGEINRELDQEFLGSKIRSGKSFTKFVKLYQTDFKNNKWLYDDDIVYTKILKLLINHNAQNNINNYYNDYRGSVSNTNQNLPSQYELNNNFEYFDINIASSLTLHKLSIKSINNITNDLLSDSEINQIYLQLLAIPLFGIILAGLFIAVLIAAKINGTKKSTPAIFSMKKYGQFADLLQQRLYTTETYRHPLSFLDQPQHVATQSFINEENGIEITDVINYPTRNVSKTLELYNSGYKSIDNNGIIIQWTAQDFFELKHVTFNDNITEVFS